MDSRRGLILSLLAATRSELAAAETQLVQDEQRIAEWLASRRAHNEYLRTRVAQYEEDLEKVDPPALPLTEIVGKADEESTTSEAVVQSREDGRLDESPYNVSEAVYHGALFPDTAEEKKRSKTDRVRIVVEYLVEREGRPMLVSELLDRFGEIGFEILSPDPKDTVHKAISRSKVLNVPGVPGAWLVGKDLPVGYDPKSARSASRTARRAKKLGS